MANTPLQEIDPRHKILVRPARCHEARTATYDVMAHPYRYAVKVHANCICNEYAALHNRHIIDRTSIPFDRKLWMSVARETARFYPKNLVPCSYEEIVNGYTGKKKRMYHNAMVMLRTEGLRSKHWKVSMFIKPDRYPAGDCETKDPRAIQYRSPEFNLAFGAYIKPFEETIYPTLTYDTVSNTRVIVKGMNNFERAELFLHKIDHFRKPIFVLLDHSRFDSTINVDHLKSTHRKYQRGFASRKLADLCKKQLNNKCISKWGIVYTARGTRMSGDADTACGNSVVNADALYGFLTRSRISKYDFMLDGDDSVVIIESCDEHLLDYTIFGRLGFNTKMEVVRELHEVEFCQAKLILGKRPVFSRNPTRAMSHAAGSRKQYPRQTWSKWATAVGMCEKAMNPGVPILSVFGEKLSQVSTEWFIDEDYQERWKQYQPETAAKIQITDDARESFALAWGISPEIQVMIESFDYTSHVYKCEEKLNRISATLMQYESERLDKLTWLIAGSTESAPQFSGCCWWSSYQTRFEQPGTGCF